MRVSSHLANLITTIATTTAAEEVTTAAPDLSWRQTLWRPANGRETRICDLSDDHVRSIIFYMHREWGVIMAAETLTKFKDMASADTARPLERAHAEIAEQLMETRVHEDREHMYRIMLQEADFRKLGWAHG